MFTPVKLGNTTLPPEVLKADKKSCKRYGPCGVGEQLLHRPAVLCGTGVRAPCL